MNRFPTPKHHGLLWAVLVLIAFPAHAYTPPDYYRCTRDHPLAEALTILDQSPSHDTVTYAVESKVRILFKDMRELGKAYRYHDALSVITDDNHHLIFISDRHRLAPPQALAALISHEALHADRENSLQEETATWTREAQTWDLMQHQYPELQQIPIRQFPLVDRLNAISILLKQNRLEQEIRQNVAYQGLPQHSPGF